jgi:mannose-6-phosphate isomerase-like protein (cupin superfamily)
MRLRAIVLALFGIAISLDASALTTYSHSPWEKNIAVATIPDRDGIPLYFSVVAGTLEDEAVRGISSGDGIYYQLTGSVDITEDGKTQIINPGSGRFIPLSTKYILTNKQGKEQSTYLYFVLYSDLGHQSAVTKSPAEQELFRSPAPILGMMRERNLLTLSRVEVAPQSPCDPLHSRSGAALHYVLSGDGAEFTKDRATARGPGSISYEPNGLAYQWSNPGANPLIYLLFNVNPKGAPPVIAADERPADPFSADSHLTKAMYCVGLAMILTAIVAAGIAADAHRDVKPGKGRSGR